MQATRCAYGLQHVQDWECMVHPHLNAKPTPPHATAVVAHDCSASIGVLVFSDKDALPGDIVKRADAAMCQAKDKGRTQVAFDAPV